MDRIEFVTACAFIADSWVSKDEVRRLARIASERFASDAHRFFDWTHFSRAGEPEFWIRKSGFARGDDGLIDLNAVEYHVIMRFHSRPCTIELSGPDLVEEDELEAEDIFRGDEVDVDVIAQAFASLDS
jgi:hypothetical protein